MRYKTGDGADETRGGSGGFFQRALGSGGGSSCRKREQRMRADQQQSLLLATTGRQSPAGALAKVPLYATALLATDMLYLLLTGKLAEALAKVALYATSCKDSQEVLSLLAVLVQKYRY